jgi:putative methyltransferase (TIGR04325 family)
MIDLLGKAYRRVFRTGDRPGWHGDFSSWKEASNPQILERVCDSLRKVRRGEAAFERDSVAFSTVEYSFPLLAALLWIASREGRLHVLDFGGSLGSSYYQHRRVLTSVKQVSWSVVEQENVVVAGRAEFEDDILRFFTSIDECKRAVSSDVLLLSSVVQYLEAPHAFIDGILRLDFPYVLTDRTPFIDHGRDRLTRQVVYPHIYEASYPCWFLDEGRFLSHFADRYETVFEFDALDRANILSRFKGFLFVRKDLAQV